MKTLTLAAMALLLATPLVAQDPQPAPVRTRAAVPELTAQQRTQLRAIQDRHRAALRAQEDARIAANRKLEDELRGVLTEEQFRMMRGRMGAAGAGRGGAAGRRPAALTARGMRQGSGRPAMPARPGAPGRGGGAAPR